ncbi:hypothetical protein DFH09DRAFT_1098458 [Mycena vulgaris]|nr:hypothetical protein DFH09DRAFT_1098458 [Mycena vulgaris]
MCSPPSFASTAMFSSSGPQRKPRSIASLLNPASPSEEYPNRQQRTHIDAGPTRNENGGAARATHRMHLAHGVSDQRSDNIAGPSRPYPPSAIFPDGDSPLPHASTATRYYSPTFHSRSEDRAWPPQAPQKRGISDIYDAEEQPHLKRSGKTRAKAVSAAAALGTMYAISSALKGISLDEAPARGTPVVFSADTKLRPEIQDSRCMSKTYKDFPRCMSCTSHAAQEPCRFLGVRILVRDSEYTVRAFSFRTQSVGASSPMLFPRTWNIPLDSGLIEETKKIIAAALLPTLHEEMHRIIISEVVHMPKRCNDPAACGKYMLASCSVPDKSRQDTCRASIFCSSWMCRVCGRAVCAECFRQVEALTLDPNGAADLRNSQLHGNPEFLRCLRGTEHRAQDFSILSRIDRTELTEVIRDMEGFLRTQPSLTAASENRSDDWHSASSAITSASSAELPARPIQRFENAELTEDIFRGIWAKGHPLVVTGVDRKLKIKWTPEYFTQRHGSQECVAIECQVNTSQGITPENFFGGFGHYDGRTQCWMLKDWPSTGFKSVFPELYDDFCQAVPMPNYVRMDGVRNLASHFPSNGGGPNLKPRIHTANANLEAAHSKGSMRLHLDWADALNVMTYAASDPAGQEGSAVWDIFRHEDRHKIRQFVRERLKLGRPGPLFNNEVYLNDAARRALWEEHGVNGYRVYQKAGDAVFIPAGCAYQVCNLSDCIMVTTSFVSPENIKRCEMVAMDAGSLRRIIPKPTHSVLPLKTILWFAWLSCCRQAKALVASGI